MLTPDPAGGYVVTSPDVPERVTEGDTPEQALANVRHAIAAARELYEDSGLPFPASINVASGPIAFDALIEAA